MKIPSLPPGVTVTTLDNGLTIIVREDHSAPVVSAQAWCMAGSIHEGKWLGAGMSHVLEHMLFKGTVTRPGIWKTAWKPPVSRVASCSDAATLAARPASAARLRSDCSNCAGAGVAVAAASGLGGSG